MKINRAIMLTVSAGALAICAGAAPALAQDAPADTSSDDGGWTPLDSKNTGSELFQKWIPVPNGDSGAPRQGWLNTADGFFTREAHLAYSYIDGDGFDGHQVLARFNYPLSRRLWAGIEVPFYNEAGFGPFRGDGFGDITVSGLLMLVEKKNLSINTGASFQLPTATNDFAPTATFAVTPQINWWSDIGHGFSFRGRFAYRIADSGQSDDFQINGTLGQTVTPHGKVPFGDLTWYVAANYSLPLKGFGFSQLSVTPGMRTHLGNNLFLLTGVEFQIGRSFARPYDRRYIVQLVQGF